MPVIINTNQWTALAARGRRAADLLRSPVDNLREQILNAKWRLEDVADDRPIPEQLDLGPELGCLRGTEFDMAVTWQDDGPPKCIHPLTDPEQIDDLDVPDPAGGLNRKRIAWYREMAAATSEFAVTLNGRRLPVKVGLGQPGGPIPSAFALAGVNMMLWFAEEPERMQRLMHVVTESHLNCVRYFDRMMGRDPDHPMGLGADAIEMLSPAMVRQQVLPYYLRIWEAHPGPRGIHNCGPNEHLLDLMRDEMRITAHNGFGFCVDPQVLADKMAGRVLLTGGPNPSLLKSGSRDQIMAEGRRYIEILGIRGGFILSLGGGTAPGTPAEHYEYLVEASRQVGCPRVA